MKKVAIIILNWNGRDLLRASLISLRQTDYPDFKTIVVDNGSTDGSPEFVMKDFPQIDLIRLTENKGYAVGNNVGLRYAIEEYNADYFVLLNNDTEIIQKNWLIHMVAVAESSPDIGMVNCQFIRPNGAPQPMGLRIMPGVYLTGLMGIPIASRNAIEQSRYIHETDSAGGACFLIKRSVIEKIGLIDEGYSPVYFEDIDYGLRAKEAKFRLVHDGMVSVIHLGSSTSKKFVSSYLTYVYRKNLIRFVKKYHPTMLTFILTTMVVASLLQAMRSAGSTGFLKRLAQELWSIRLALKESTRADLKEVASRAIP